MKYQVPRGTHDILPFPIPGKEEFDIARWQHLESIFAELCALYGYSEIRTPAFEDRDLFIRSSGETSDIVSKEMYDFTDKGERLLSLKPEGTAPVMRSYLEHNLGMPGHTTRLSYVTPAFRYGRPGLGRYRQFHQFGLELIGPTDAAADFEIIEFTLDFFKRIGINGLRVMVNSIGRAETRERYSKVVLKHLESWLAEQSTEEQAKAHKNPLRLLDTKDKTLKAALEGISPLHDSLEDSSKAHFDKLQSLMSEAGVDFVHDPTVVRGLDYYTDTVFEVIANELGSEISLCGGGRYDNLISEMGGPATPSVGVGIGIERLVLTLVKAGVEPPRRKLDAFIVCAGDETRPAARELARRLRVDGLAVQMDADGKGLKAQFKQADRSGARFAVVIGDEEIASGQYTVKDLATTFQSRVPMDDLADTIRPK